MSAKEKELYEFGDFRLDVAEHFLVRSGGERVPLSEKAFETLCILVRNAGHLVSKNELLNEVWADSFVEENNLNKSIHAIRRALGEKSGAVQYIETVKKHGFRFVAEVRRIEAGAEPLTDEDALYPQSKIFPAQEFSPLSVKQTAIKASGKVVALADWRPEAETNRPKESNGRIAGPESVSSKPVTRRRPNYRVIVLAALIFGAGALGFYLYTPQNKPGGDKKSFAVLPFKAIDTATREELLEIGIADSLILRLGSIKGFIVRPINATRKYADLAQDPLAAGHEQQVDYVLVSNYQLADGKIKITAQLFNVANGQIEETYQSEKDATNTFAMQDAVAYEVGNLLMARFAAVLRSPAAKRGTTNEEAYRLYLHGRNLTYNQDAANARKAIENFDQAVRLDPDFARAYAGMAHAFIALGNLGGGLPQVEYTKARAGPSRKR
jgi:DNA-binding winged helix-turn-helix (wHTH) protein/TolB-like protein